MLRPDILTTLKPDTDPIPILIEQGFLQEKDVEQLQKELSLDEYETITPSVKSKTASPPSTETIAVFGRYVQLEFLGQGGMARVFKAFDPALSRTVALKVVKVDDPRLAHRLLLEARSQARIEHEHVCKIYEVGEVDGKPYIAMQYIAGETLKQKKGLTLKEKVQLMRQVAEGVHAAHKAGLIHRDLKPSNILIEQRESGHLAYVMDFGLAHESQAPSLSISGLVVGTPAYMSPEQAKGEKEKLDASTDIYGIGATLYEVVTGRVPFDGSSTTDILIKVLQQEPIQPRKIDPSLPDDLQTIILKCLEKNPERRYKSARSLSEDLSRFLDGDPILAKPATSFYKASKKIKKHPVVSALIGIAVLAVIVFAAIAGMVQWRAKKQAQLFQEFGQEVTRIEAIMRYAYLLPLHDIQNEKNQVNRRLDRIKQRMNLLGDMALGPGSYAIGRGYLSLHRYQDAYDYLNQAWEKYSYREPEVSNALGLSLAMLYQDKLREAERTYTREQIEQKKFELRKKYRDPALKYLQYSTSESSEYASALIAFLEENYQEALRQSETATQKVSWLYEGHLLQGNAFIAMGNAQQEIGKIDEASRYYENAKKAFFAAAQKGQSDPQAYEGLCTVQSSIQKMLIDHKRDSPESVLQEGLEYCKKALQADSKYASANLVTSDLYKDWARNQKDHGANPSGSIDKALSFAQAALQLEPENGLAHRAIGNAFSIRAQSGIDTEQDVIPSLNRAIASLEKASTKMPEDHEVLSLLGLNYRTRGQYEVYSGKDPRPSYEKAIQYLKRSIDLNSKYYKYYAVLGAVYYEQGSYQYETNNADSTATLMECVNVCKKSIEINPNYFNSYYYMGSAYLTLANFQTDRGEYPAAADQAIEIYKKSLTLDPANAFSNGTLGIAFWKKGDYLQKHGKDPTADLEEAREAFKKSIKANDKVLYNHAIYTEVELVAARYAIDQKKSPAPFFKEAERILHGAFQINPDSVECLESLAALHISRAEYLLSLKQSATNEIRQGIDACDRALKQDAENSYLEAHRGKLFLLRARSESGDLRKKAAQEAKSSFERAFKIKPALQNEYKGALEEVSRLSTYEN